VVTTLLTALLWSTNAHSETLVDSALRFFAGNDSNTAGFDLDSSRPQPASPASIADVLKSVPTDGRVIKLKQPQKEKLDSLAIVLQLHQRQGVYEFIVFESSPRPFAFIGLHQRAVLMISDVALNLLDTAELEASAAHEIGHEYVWAEYLDAVQRNDDRRLKELELICDGVAILTLQRAGVNPMTLLTAAAKITNFNVTSTGPAANGHRYPSAQDRKRFANAMIARAASHSANN
jgi:peptidase M48-like protein